MDVQLKNGKQVLIRFINNTDTQNLFNYQDLPRILSTVKQLKISVITQMMYCGILLLMKQQMI
jgi:hypothetical protein